MALNTNSPLYLIPLEIGITDQLAGTGKQVLTGYWRELRTNPLIPAIVVTMIDALINSGEDLYLFVDMVLGGDHITVSQIV